MIIRKFLRPASSIFLTGVFSLSFDTAQAAPAFPEAAGADTAGFVPIFDGKTLTNWDADPKYWRVQDGSLVGEVTP